MDPFIHSLHLGLPFIIVSFFTPGAQVISSQFDEKDTLYPGNVINLFGGVFYYKATQFV